ncbi:MAG: asparaginase domain-containing protein [Candidatus Paceibacterota bacterium]
MSTHPITEHNTKIAGAVLPWISLEELSDKAKDQLAQPRKRGVKRIACLYYGGTAFMHYVPVLKDGKPVFDSKGQPKRELVPTDDPTVMLKPLYDKALLDKVEIVWVRATSDAIDSVNGRWAHWVSIGNCSKLLYDHVDGFVVIGGTDTMAFLMAAIWFMFPNFGKPLIGCGAQVTIEDLGDDATRNFYFAILAACADISGAHLAFNQDLMHGLHVFKVRAQGFDAFTSPTRFIIGGYDGELRLNGNEPKRNGLVTGKRLIYRPYFLEGIKVVELTPATPSKSIIYDSMDSDCFALLLRTFGAGNVRNKGIYASELTQVEAIQKVHQRGYPVILGSPMMDGRVESPYATGAAVSPEIGGISGGDTCGPTLHVKAMVCGYHAWDHNNDRLDYDKFRRLMYEDHVGELTMSMAA